jgi:ABC-type phosphate/phosphonate transport system substrate-binding protein
MDRVWVWIALGGMLPFLSTATAAPALGAGPGPTTVANKTLVRIGALAFRSKEKTRHRWQPTADYLTSKIPGKTFVVVPLNFPEVDRSVGRSAVDFVITNTSHFVNLSHRFGVSQLATLVKQVNGRPLSMFGGVIFTRADRGDIGSLDDLRGKRLKAVQRSSLGGYIVALEQFKNAHIELGRDVELSFTGMPHDNVVHAVARGEVDAGTVRTSVLESLAEECVYKLSDFKILAAKREPGFPFLLSTRLFPEWPALALIAESLAKKRDAAFAPPVHHLL